MKPRFPLTVKFFFLILTIVSVPVAALVGLSLFLQQTLQADVERKVETTLNLAMNMEVSFISEALLHMGQVAAGVALDPEVVSGADRRSGLINLGRLAGAFPRADLIIVVDREAVARARSTSPFTGDRILLDGLVARVLEGGGPATYPTIIGARELQHEGDQIREQVDMQILPTTLSQDPRIGGRVDSALALVGVAPIRNAMGAVIGAVIAADVLNRDFRIVDEIANQSPRDVPMNATIAMDGIRVTTNVRLKTDEGHPTEHRALGTVYSDPVMESLRKNHVYRGRALVVDQWQRTIYSPLTDFQGRIVAGPYVGIPEAYFTAAGAEINRYVNIALVAAAIALVIALIIGWWLTRRGIVNPVNRFIRQIREGGTEQQISHPANDEIGDLADALSELLGRIHEVVDQVRTVAREVTGASSSLHDAAQLTSGEAVKALSLATETMTTARKLNVGAAGTIERLIALRQAFASVAEGARRQERSVRYTTMVVTEIARAIGDARERTGLAIAAVDTLSSGARAGLRSSASLTAAIGILRQQILPGSPSARALDLIRDPAELLATMSTAAESLAEEVRHMVLSVQENEARLRSIHEELERVSQVTGKTATATADVEENAAGIITWMEAAAHKTANVAEEVESAQSSIDGIAAASRRLAEMAAEMKGAAERLHHALGRLRQEDGGGGA